MDQHQEGKTCSCPHHKMMPMMILLIGLSFLLTALGVYSAHVNSIIWPILLILIGLKKMMRCKCC